MELYPGAVVAGRYRVDRKIGAGGMGEVWAGEHVAIGVRVAVKTLPPEAARDRQIVARFRREAQLLGRLRSERVARVVDFVEDPSFGLVLVMDFVEGESLGAVLAARRLSVDEAIEVGVDIASALADLHRVKVVHRDLKPDNVILEPLPGGRRRAVIVDLGVSRVEAGACGDDAVTSITQVDMAVGTLPYMAPEQLLHSSAATAAADVYALGAILYRAVSGQLVFGDEDDAAAAKRKLTMDAPPLSMARVDRVAGGLAAIVGRALEREPERRWASAEAMLAALTELAGVARALSFDLDAPTEQALPGDVPGLSVPPTLEVEPTQRMSRPPVHPDEIEDEATHVAPASQALPRSVDVVFSSRPPASPTDPLTTSAIHPSRPTQHSPVLAPAPPGAANEGAAGLRTMSVRAAVLGMVAALVVGIACGYGAHAASVSRPAPISPHR